MGLPRCRSRARWEFWMGGPKGAPEVLRRFLRGWLRPGSRRLCAEHRVRSGCGGAVRRVALLPSVTALLCSLSPLRSCAFGPSVHRSGVFCCFSSAPPSCFSRGSSWSCSGASCREVVPNTCFKPLKPVTQFICLLQCLIFILEKKTHQQVDIIF